MKLKMFKAQVETTDKDRVEVLLAAPSLREAVEWAKERERWVVLLREEKAGGQPDVLRVIEVDEGKREVGTAWPAEGFMYLCPWCGGSEVETTASVNLNTQEIVSFEENATYWCPSCGELGEHRHTICHVRAGVCEFHEQPFEVCRAKHSAKNATA